jgi:hypothetical protein
MSRSSLVKVGLPPQQAESMKKLRRIHQILEQHQAAVSRLDAATNERIKEVVNEPDRAMVADEEPAAATA